MWYFNNQYISIMKILCIQNNLDGIYPEFGSDEISIPNHDVTIVHNKADALLMLRDGAIDIILCDLNFPADNQDQSTSPYGALFCLWQEIPEYRVLYKVKAIGILAPQYITQTFQYAIPDDELVCITTNNCITPTGHRDWVRLFKMIRFRLKRAGIKIR